MAREKLNSKVVFGQKIHASLTNGCTCLHIISWDAFSESPSMMDCPERHNNLFGYYPKKVFADRAYCTRENRQKLKDLRISLAAKPLGSPGTDHGRRGSDCRHADQNCCQLSLDTNCHHLPEMPFPSTKQFESIENPMRW
jgi:hypothetical protein